MRVEVVWMITSNEWIKQLITTTFLSPRSCTLSSTTPVSVAPKQSPIQFPLSSVKVSAMIDFWFVNCNKSSVYNRSDKLTMSMIFTTGRLSWDNCDCPAHVRSEVSCFSHLQNEPLVSLALLPHSIWYSSGGICTFWATGTWDTPTSSVPGTRSPLRHLKSSPSIHFRWWWMTLWNS